MTGFAVCRLKAAGAIIALALPCLLAPAQASAEDMMKSARDLGELHGAAIYCRQKNTDSFGRLAMGWLQRHGGGQFEKLRDTYGLRVIETAHQPPTYAAGGSCAGFAEKYRDAWIRLKG
ncbi:MAG TPA: hypothetical protein PK405_07345 [Hyphomicrobiales bacterium]|nr:hypothetical protein [Rhodobiaceae bacterium]HXK54485.1 hypothetical protein [Hyphomicrobiales bacterium]